MLFVIVYLDKLSDRVKYVSMERALLLLGKLVLQFVHELTCWLIVRLLILLFRAFLTHAIAVAFCLIVLGL